MINSLPDITKLNKAELKEIMHFMERKRYQCYPQKWMIDRMMEDPKSIEWSLYPQYKNHEWDGTKDPFLVMCQALANKMNVGIESATGTGKTYMAARIGYWFLDSFPDSLVITTAPKQSQLKAVLWSEIGKCFKKFKKYNPKAERYTLRVLPSGRVKVGNLDDDEDINDGHQMIGVVSGVGANEESATKMQGYHRQNMLFIIDELAGVSPAVLKAITNTSTGENNLIIGFGNPDSQTDPLHQFCERPNTVHIVISGLDHPNVVTNKEVVPGAVTNKSIDERRLEYGDESPFFKSRVRGIAPAQASDSLIQMSWIKACIKNDVEFDHNILDQRTTTPEGEPLYPRDSENALGIDVANSEQGDMACLAWGQKNVLVELHEFQCPNANALADNVIMYDDELEAQNIPVYKTSKAQDMGVDMDKIGVDAVGVGVGTINEFSRNDWEVQSLQGGPDKDCIPLDDRGEPKYNFQSMRAQMLFQLRVDLMNHDMIIDIPPEESRELAKQCTLIKYKMTDRMIQIESKDNIKKRLGGKSPNKLDAFAYWNWVRKDRRIDQETTQAFLNM